MAEQLIFDWPTGVALGPADFFVSDANATAFALVQTPDAWPEGKLCIVGPAGAGKSHLARVFAAETGAQIIPAPQVRFDAPPACPVVIEDMEALPPSAEEAMFHLHNALRAARLPMLLTARVPPARWQIRLPDLASRMQATTPALIADPDDALLQAVLIKLFADRQVMPGKTVLDFLTRQMERSFDAAARIVAALDAEALRRKKPISRAMARSVLDKLTDTDG